MYSFRVIKQRKYPVYQLHRVNANEQSNCGHLTEARMSHLSSNGADLLYTG